MEESTTEVISALGGVGVWGVSGDKWGAMATLTILSMFFGMFPYLLFTFFRQVIRSDSKLCKIVLSTFSSVSGGFLLSITTLHILPEVREKAEGAGEGLYKEAWGALMVGSGGQVPPAELLMLYGFCLIYGIEEVAQFLVRVRSGEKNKRKSTITGQQLTILNCPDKDCQHAELIIPDDDCPLNEKPPLSPSPISFGDGDSGDYHTYGSGGSSPGSSDLGIRGSVLTLHKSVAQDEVRSPVGTLRTLVSVLALSFHAIMEGIAVGVQDSSDLWILLGSIASHKCIIAVILGLQFQGKLGIKTFIASITLFSVMSPIGIFIGSVMAASADDLTKAGSTESAAWVVLVEGLACGTLLYIIFFEILTPSHQDHDHNPNDSKKGRKEGEHGPSFDGLLRLAGVVVGVMLGAYLLSLASHSHSHGQGHSHGHHEHLVEGCGESHSHDDHSHNEHPQDDHDHDHDHDSHEAH